VMDGMNALPSDGLPAQWLNPKSIEVFH
jgi:hypothetical protein